MFHNLNAENTFNKLLNNNTSIIKPRGLIIEVYLNPQTTKFTNKIKVSKKVRRSTEKMKEKPKPVLQYTIVGKVIAYKKRGNNSSFQLRNAVDLCAFEGTHQLFSPTISYLCVHNLFKHRFARKYKRANAYYYRKCAASKAMVDFSYVIDQYVNIKNNI